MKLIDKGVLILAAPVFAGHLLSFLFGAADTVFVSMLDRNTTALVTGVGLTMPLNLLVLAVGTGLMTGTASLVARANGAGDAARVARAGKAALALGLGCAVAMGALFILGADALAAAFAGDSVSAAAREAAKTYLLWAAPGFAVLVPELAILGLLMGEGKTAVYGAAMALGTIVNLVLDPLFMFVFGWGVAGAAAATSAATLVGAAYIVAAVSKEAARFGLSRRKAGSGAADARRPAARLTEDAREAEPRQSAATGETLEIVRVGLPQALSLLIVSLTFMALNRVMGSFGEVRLNAWVVVGRVEECVLMIGYAVGSACMILAGNFWGAGKRRELEDAVRRCLRTSLAVSVLVVVPYLALAPLIFKAFSGNAAVVDACASQVRAVSWSTAGVVVSLVAVSGLQGMGKAIPSLLLILCRLGLFLVLPVTALSAAGVLSLPLFLAVFASSSVLGGAVSAAAIMAAARSVPASEK